MSQTEPSSPNELRTSRGSRQWLQHKGWRLLLGIVLFLVVAHGLLVLAFKMHFDAGVRAIKAKGEPVSSAELAGSKLPDSQNGAIQFEKAFKLLETKEGKKAVELLGKMNPPVPWPEGQRAAMELGAVVPLTEVALSRPSCQFPIKWVEGARASFGHLGSLRSLVKVLSMAAVIDAQYGRMDEAYRKIMLAFKAAKVCRNEPSLISTLVTLACTEFANKGLVGVIKCGKPNEKQTVELNKLLADTNYEGSMVNSLKGERAVGLSGFNNPYYDDRSFVAVIYGNFISSYDNPEPDRYKLQALISLARPLIYADGVIYTQVMSKYLAILEKRDGNVKQQQMAFSAVSNSIPRYAMTALILCPVYSTGALKLDSTRARTALTQILLAAQRYKASNGQYPETMAQVRSAGIADIPMDPFSGKEFIYRRTAKGFTVYSIGEDFKDDGGRPVDKRQSNKGGDIVLKWE